MEYSLYINQVAAVNWDLSMGEALLFSYLINTGGWADRAPDGSDFVWMANAKLATELPIVCKHKDSAKRLMRGLEEKGLLNRKSIGNKSYFLITDKGALWKSKTLRSDESVRPIEEGRTDRSEQSDESALPRSDQSAPQSDIPLIKETKSKVKPSFSFAAHLAEQYGYSPHLFSQKHRDFFHNWEAMGVTAAEFSEAHLIACKTLKTDSPSVNYINGVLRNSRNSENSKVPAKKPVKPAGQTVSTDPLGDNTAAYEAKAAAELAARIAAMTKQAVTE